MSDDAGEDWSPQCWDCEHEFSRPHLNRHPVHIEHEDGLGYDRVDVPLCDSCRKDRMCTHECESCGQEYLDLEGAVMCCPDRRGRSLPDGGSRCQEQHD